MSCLHSTNEENYLECSKERKKITVCSTQLSGGTLRVGGTAEDGLDKCFLKDGRNRNNKPYSQLLKSLSSISLEFSRTVLHSGCLAFVLQHLLVIIRDGITSFLRL